MKTIWKFPIPVTDSWVIEVPKGAVFLNVAESEVPATISLWAEVDPEQPLVPRMFVVLGTGNQMPEGIHLRHVSTVRDRQFVWHVYEVVSQ